jgi:hypothetical protein
MTPGASEARDTSEELRWLLQSSLDPGIELLLSLIRLGRATDVIIPRDGTSVCSFAPSTPWFVALSFSRDAARTLCRSSLARTKPHLMLQNDRSK